VDAISMRRRRGIAHPWPLLSLPICVDWLDESRKIPPANYGSLWIAAGGGWPKDEDQRLEVYRRVQAYSPTARDGGGADGLGRARRESARNLLSTVRLTPEAERAGLALIHTCNSIHSAPDYAFEAARA
jgi:hypothetical protein